MATDNPRREEESQQKRSHDFVTGQPTGGSQESEPLSAVQDRAAKMASAVATTAEQTWDRAKHGIQDMSSQVGTQAGQLWDSMISCMRSYPLAVFFTGIGVGFVLAHMLENRD
jgi:hypothetical protein